LQLFFPLTHKAISPMLAPLKSDFLSNQYYDVLKT
jgi:hypothetical protein